MDFRTTTQQERECFYEKVKAFMLPVWADAEVYLPLEGDNGHDQFDPQIQFRYKTPKEVVATADNTKGNTAYNIDLRHWWNTGERFTIKPIGIAFSLSRLGEKSLQVFVSVMVWQRPYRCKYGTLDHYNKKYERRIFFAIEKINLDFARRIVEDFLRLNALKH